MSRQAAVKGIDVLKRISLIFRIHAGAVIHKGHGQGIGILINTFAVASFQFADFLKAGNRIGGQDIADSQQGVCREHGRIDDRHTVLFIAVADPVHELQVHQVSGGGIAGGGPVVVGHALIVFRHRIIVIDAAAPGLGDPVEAVIISLHVADLGRLGLHITGIVPCHGGLHVEHDHFGVKRKLRHCQQQAQTHGDERNEFSFPVPEVQIEEHGAGNGQQHGKIQHLVVLPVLNEVAEHQEKAESPAGLEDQYACILFVFLLSGPGKKDSRQENEQESAGIGITVPVTVRPLKEGKDRAQGPVITAQEKAQGHQARDQPAAD